MRSTAVQSNLSPGQTHRPHVRFQQDLHPVWVVTFSLWGYRSDSRSCVKSYNKSLSQYRKVTRLLDKLTFSERRITTSIYMPRFVQIIFLLLLFYFFALFRTYFKKGSAGRKKNALIMILFSKVFFFFA